jgi:nucleoside-diphosphate-sugar epimerase
LKQTISILGCGWLGLPLAIHLTTKGYDIKGSNTNNRNANILKNNNIIPFIVDISTSEDVSEFLTADVLVILITNKYSADFKRLIAQIEKSTIQNVLFISSSSVYPNTNKVVTETTPTKDTPLSEIENLFRANTNFKTTILRFGGLFGYDRKPGNFIKPGKQIENPEGFINLIHQDDCINIIENIIAKNCWNETLNACADSHPTRKEFYTKEVLKLRNEAPPINENSLNEFKIVSNNKLKQILNYEFKVNDLMNYSK